MSEKLAITVSDSEPKLEKLTEFETKYRVGPEVLTEFKSVVGSIASQQPDAKFIYVEGPDEYWVSKDKFLRYRRPSFGLDGGRSEVTMKTKPEGAKNNQKRREWNWRVDNTPAETIREGFKDLGFEFNFSIWKSCHIYVLDDATLVMYTVYDTTTGKPTKTDSFIEIELHEDDIHDKTYDEAMAIIVKYEKVLSDIGVTARSRLKKSLYEMYVRDTK